MQNNRYIWDAVKELLNGHDCVIVPGFGGFVGNREPARIDQVSHLITPPAKRIVFNQNLKSNDGLLANRVAEKKQLGYKEALQLIEEVVNQTRDVLQDKKHLDIEWFGSFRLNADANYVFLPEKQNNYLPSSFGLLPLQAEPIAARTASTGKKRVRIFRDRRETLLARSKKKSNWGPKALIGVLTLLLGINSWIFFSDHNLRDLHVGNSEMNISTWFDSAFSNGRKSEPQPAAPAPVSTAQPAAPVVAVPEPVTDSIAITPSYTTEQLLAFGAAIGSSRTNWKVPAEPAAIIEEPAPVTEMPVAAEPGNEPSGKKMPANNLAGKSAATDSLFYVIGGVFCKERNAVRYCKQMKERGYTPELLVNTNINCKRVSIAKFSRRKEAEAFLTSIKTGENPAAWIFSQGK